MNFTFMQVDEVNQLSDLTWRKKQASNSPIAILDLENYCPKPILTYNYVIYDGSTTFGGFSDKVVVDHHYVLRFPDNLPLNAASPLLCVGITVYSPMKYFGFSEPGKHRGVVGLGGLGHMAIKFGKAFRLNVLVISPSTSKEKEALERLGADSFLVSRDLDQMQAAMGTITPRSHRTGQVTGFPLGNPKSPGSSNTIITAQQATHDQWNIIM
ncbi:probable mannitol dehydrogenase [Macadamia integrifolia]|uniref:probable mannitol dehydrogenase n=1 Tax=Macadamia integrifolia TaxID=60698 RepID=UPI001C52DE64|nr:probable mannitol dehydrogenase [Macadamia integrifolia]